MRFAMAVAAASANDGEAAIVITASAFPRLNECPDFPDEVHIPKGLRQGDIAILRLLKFELSARSKSCLPMADRIKMSPPFSTIMSRLKGSNFRPTYSAIAPATEAMGPTLALDAASIIVFIILGAKGSYFRG
jgi:hypothetical protein